MSYFMSLVLFDYCKSLHSEQYKHRNWSLSKTIETNSDIMLFLIFHH